MRCKLFLRLFLLLAISGLLLTAHAQSMWVGAVTGANTFNFSPTFCCGNEATKISPTTAAMYDHSATDSFKQLDLILAIPNAPATITLTSIAAYTNVGNVPGNNTISAGSPNSTTATSISAFNTAVYTNGSSQDAYTALGTGAAGQGTPSENFTNFAAADAAAGITATAFYLYEYNLNSFANNFGHYGLLNITFSAPLPNGTIAIGWGCGSTNGCSPQYNSVFTQSGIAAGTVSLSAVPEPSAVILLGTVSLVILRLWKGKRRDHFTA